MEGAFTSDLNYAMKKSAVKSRSYRSTVSPIGGSANLSPSDTIKYDIPLNRNTYLDTSMSYLEFTVKNTDPTATTTFTVDSSAYAFIQRLEVYSGGTLLESIDNYGAFCTLMIDAQVAGGDRGNHFSVAMGAQAAPNTNVNRGGIAIARNASANFCIPLVSSVFGSFLSKMLPLHAIKSDLRLEIVLASAQSAVISTSTTVNYQVTSAVLQLSMLELDNDAQRMIDSANGDNYYISTECYRNYSTILNSGASADSILIPARFSSVKSILGIYRPSADVTAQDKHSLTGRLNPYVGGNPSLQFQIGASQIPATPMNSIEEIHTESIKAYHNLSNSSQQSVINATNWAINASATTSANSGTFYLALNTESIAQRNDVINSGVSSLNLNIFLNSTYGTALASSTRFDSWVHFDGVLAIENGSVTMKF